MSGKNQKSWVTIRNGVIISVAGALILALIYYCAGLLFPDSETDSPVIVSASYNESMNTVKGSVKLPSGDDTDNYRVVLCIKVNTDMFEDWYAKPTADDAIQRIRKSGRSNEGSFEIQAYGESARDKSATAWKIYLVPKDFKLKENEYHVADTKHLDTSSFDVFSGLR